MAARGIRATRFLRILCAALLIVLGFAHKPLPAYQGGPDQVAAYMLPDGTLPDLCSADPGPGKAPGQTYHGCDACRLAASIVLPAPAAATSHVFGVEIADAFRQGQEHFRRLVYPPGTPPRGPPSRSELA